MHRNGVRCNDENSVRKRDAAFVGAGKPANTGGTGAILRGACFAAVRRLDTPAPTRECGTLSNIVPCATAQPKGLGNLPQIMRRLSGPGYRPCNSSTAWSNTANGSAAL